MSAAAKMVADSTQSDMTVDQHSSKEIAEERSDRSHSSSKLKRRKNLEAKKNKKAKKSGKKGTKKKNESAALEENNPDLDLDIVLKEIGDYIKDRQEMVNQMFHCVSGASLQRALPDVLKNIPMDELKQRCVEHLEVMSKKRINRIMAGDDPSVISSSGTEDETSDEDVTNADRKCKEKPQSQPADSTSQTGERHSDIEDMTVQEETTQETEDIGRVNDDASPEEQQWSPESSRSGSEEGERRSPVPDGHASVNPALQDVQSGELVWSGVQGPEDRDSEGDSQDGERNTQDGERDSQDGEGQEEQSSSDYEQMVTDSGEEQTVKGRLKTSESESNTLIPVLTKNQMELLELEMRAKAIKAMLSKMKK